MADFDLHRTLVEVELQPIAHIDATATLADCARLLDARCSALISFDPVRLVSARDIVRAVAIGAPSTTPVEALTLEGVFCMPDSTRLEAALDSMLNAPARRVIVQAADGKLIGRLTAAALLRAVFTCPPWIDGLQFALHIERTTVTEIE